MKSSISKLLLIGIALAFAISAHAQDQREGIIVSQDTATSKSKPHSPKLAWKLSAVLPGAGQFYNKKYWKIPILYAGIAGCVYGISFNNSEYNRFKDLNTDRSANADNPDYSDEFTGIYNNDQIRIQRDYYRRNRDFMIIISTLVYIIQIVDAHVDAHLMEFDINENLSMKVEPAFLTNFDRPSAIGLNLTFNLH